MADFSSDCFSRDDLRTYLTGWSGQALAGAIENHLQQCPSCEDTLLSLERDSDTLIQRLRTERSPSQMDDPEIDDPVLEAAFRRSRAIVPTESGSFSSDRSPHPTPASIGAYQLVRPIGSGGMGTVYLAKHRDLGKRVALKLVPTRLHMGDQRSERFLREIRAAGQLDHPQVASATDAGCEGCFHFLVMEYIDGMDLSRIVRAQGPMAIADACELMRLTALGLAYAHGEGIVHRDIKPSNVMLGVDGQVKILDFGLARLNGWDESSFELTTVGQLMGTLDYMSPEQADRPESVDYRADLYSLGATLFRLLSGRPPLAATPNLSPLAKLRLLVDHRPPRIDSLRPDVPPQLVDLIDQMLRRAPDQRPPSASHVAERLQPFAQTA